MRMFDEEESKRLRVFQRFQRQELQLIIERCNEVDFDYVCLPSVRSENDLCFGSKTPRKIHLFTDDKTVNSYVRKCFKEHFPEPENTVKATDDKTDDEACEEVEIKPSHPFSSRVPRFQDITIDSSGVYRRKRKTRAPTVVVKKVYSAFGSSSKRSFLVTRSTTKSSSNPGVGAYNPYKTKSSFQSHSFGGKIMLAPAYEIICDKINLDTCNACELEPKNVYWKHRRTRLVLCRLCYNQKIDEIKRNTRGIIEKLRKLEDMELNFERKRYCDFYHEHNKTSAAVRVLTAKDLHNRLNKENFLHSLFSY